MRARGSLNGSGPIDTTYGENLEPRAGFQRFLRTVFPLRGREGQVKGRHRPWLHVGGAPSASQLRSQDQLHRAQAGARPNLRFDQTHRPASFPGEERHAFLEYVADLCSARGMRLRGAGPGRRVYLPWDRVCSRERHARYRGATWWRRAMMSCPTAKWGWPWGSEGSRANRRQRRELMARCRRARAIGREAAA
jgi:hypothetical protein